MTLETKYNVGDRFWKITSDKPTEYTVEEITMSINERNQIKERYELRYRDRAAVLNHTLVSLHDIEKNYYPTKEKCILALFDQ